MEVWKDVAGTDGRYQISSLGRVKSFAVSAEGRILKPHANKDSDYFCASLKVNGKHMKPCIHVLVAEAFIGPRPPGFVANHKDRNRQNNQPNNLEWVTERDNARHSLSNGGRGCGVGKARMARALLGLGRFTIREVAEMLEVSKKTIRHIRDGNSWQWC